jgi:hypothetical protein
MKEVEHSDEQKLDPNKLSTTTEELNMNVSSPSAKNMNVSCPSANAQDHTVKEKEAVQTTTNKNKRKTSKQTSTITIPTQPKIAHTQPIAASSFSQPSSENFTQLVNTNFPPPTPVYYIHPISSVSVSHGQYGHATTSPIAISTSANNYLPLRGFNFKFYFLIHFILYSLFSVGSSTIAPDGSADSIMHNQMIFNSGVGVTSAAHQQHLGQTYSQGFTHPQLPPHMVYTAASSR